MQGLLPENEFGDLVTRLAKVVDENDALAIDWLHFYRIEKEAQSRLDLDVAVKSALGQLPAEADLGIGWTRTVAVALGADGYVRVQYAKRPGGERSQKPTEAEAGAAGNSAPGRRA